MASSINAGSPPAPAPASANTTSKAATREVSYATDKLGNTPNAKAPGKDC